MSDGLSSTAVEANANIIPALLNGLKGYGIETGTPFLSNMEELDRRSRWEILNADVVCILIGERPGLTTAESMSAYIFIRLSAFLNFWSKKNSCFKYS